VGAAPGDFYPVDLRAMIDAFNARIYDTVNNGVYKAGFATTQEAYEVTEIESGKRNDRPELEKALAACKRQKAKLVIAKLDRAFIATLMDSSVEFVAVDNPHANKLTVHILAAVAQHEREIISARTSAALKAAKARGKRLGNPKISDARRHAAVAGKEIAARYSANVLPVIREIQRSGIKSLRGIARALAARGIQTARGGEWTAVQVSDILHRAGCNAH
jgi:DNA invertase Pin-like site-specific DNA recombinase